MILKNKLFFKTTFFLAILFSWPLMGHASTVFHIQYSDPANLQSNGFLQTLPTSVNCENTQNTDPVPYFESNGEFEANLQEAYQFVTRRVKDPVDRALCPIQIEFKDLKCKTMGFTPKKEKECDDKIILDVSLERRWEAQVALVHELTHVLRHHYNNQEELWLDEGIAKLMEILFTGFWNRDLERTLKSWPDFILSNDPDDYNIQGRGYADSYYFLQYLYSKFGRDTLLKAILENPTETGWNNILTAIQQNNVNLQLNIKSEYLTKESVWANFAVSLVANNPSKGAHGLFFFDEHFSPITIQSLNLAQNKYSSFNLKSVSKIIYYTSKTIENLETSDSKKNDLILVLLTRDGKIQDITYFDLNHFNEIKKGSLQWVVIKTLPD